MGLFLPGVSVGNGHPDKKLDFTDPQGRKVLWVLRRQYSNSVTIYYADGSSDFLPHQEARTKLFREGVKDPDKILDYVWNFYEAKVVISDPVAKPEVASVKNTWVP
jgi:hypothetical protein